MIQISNESDPLLNRRENLNPYRMAASLIKARLMWDVNYKSWVSRSRLKAVQNRFLGKKAVILCNGPSLLDVDFKLLQDSGVHHCGLSKINLLFDNVALRPSFLVSVNGFVIEQNLDFFNTTDIPVYLDSGAGNLGIKFRENITYLHSANLRGEFARNCSWSIFQGNTVTYVAMQLAFHMGFRELALVGCDHSFSTQGPANKAVKSGEVDNNHFDPAYFSGGAVWQLPDLFQSEVAYTLAKDFYAASGGSIINASAGGRLEVFDRQQLAAFLAK
jgi:hypothetical protein